MIFALLWWCGTKPVMSPRGANAAAAKSLQSCLTLCDPMDGSPPGSPVPGILQARTLEWVAISFSNAWKWKVNVKSFSRIRLLATPWTAAYQAPPSMGFSRREYRSGVPLPSPTLPSCPTLEPWKVGHRLDWTDIAKVMRWFCFWVWPNEHIAVLTFLTDAFFRLMERFL